MRIAILYYNDFVEFEIALVCLMFADTEIVSVALEDREYRSEGKQRFLVDKIINDIDSNEIDLLVIPGGDPSALANEPAIQDFITDLLRRGKKVAAICGGAVLLARCGFLKGIRCTGNSSGITENDPDFQYFQDSFLQSDSVVVDGQIITSTAQGFIEFAMTLSQEMGILKNDTDVIENINWFKNQKS